jgi:hypothetical protein
VVGERTGDERGEGDPAQVDRRPQHPQRPRLDQGVVPEDVEELLVQPGGQVRPVGVPGEDVERGRVLAHQPLLHQVVEDQVVRAHPGEHRPHLPGADDAPPAGVAPGDLQHPRPGEGAERGLAGEVEQGHRVARGVHPVVAGRGQVVQRRRHDLAAGAQAQGGDVGGAGDLASHVDGGDDALRVLVEAPLGLLPRGVAPADHEDLQAPADRVLDEAATRAQVEEVEAPDGRRHDDQGPLPDARRRRGVLDDLDDLVPVHDGAGGDAEVLAHGEGAAIHLAGQPAVAHQVVERVPEPADDADAGGVERPLERGRVAQQGVRGRRGAGERVEHEAHLLDLAPVGAAGLEVRHQAVEGRRCRDVGLCEPAVARVQRPGRVGEPLVLRRGRDLVGAPDDAQGVPPEPDGLPRHRPGLGEGRDQPPGHAPR